MLFSPSDWQCSILNELGRDPQGLGFLVAFSGGADSTALLFSLFNASRALGIRLEACHIDHGLRLNSAKEMHLSAHFCLEIGVRWHHLRLTEKKGTDSVENWARKQRYHFLEEIRVARNLDYIITAHHAQDQIETLVMRLERGCTLRGLRGILGFDPSRSLWRPWLRCDSMQIRSALSRAMIPWIEDDSNWDLRFRRNYWRHKGLESILDSVDIKELDSMAETAQRLYSQVLAQLFIPMENPRIISDSTLEEWEDEELDFWALTLHENGLALSEKEIYHALRWAKEGRGRVLQISPRCCLVKTKDGFEFCRTEQANPAKKMLFSPLQLDLGNELSVEFAGMNYLFRSEFLPRGEAEPSPFCTLLLAENLGQTLEVRLRSDGDLFSPSPNRSKHRKLKKFLQESKIPVEQRDCMLMVCLGQNVLWIPGLKSNGCFEPQTQGQPCWKLEIYVTES